MRLHLSLPFRALIGFLPSPGLTRLLFLLLPFAAIAQAAAQDSAGNATQPAAAGAASDNGVHFEHELSWSAIQAKARAENKYIFMDCYTTWCGPCRYMSTQIFPQEQAGAWFNPRFISVKVQLDTTAKDARSVKAWYADGHAIAVKYAVYAYPTYLVFAPDGHIVHRMVGSRDSASRFIGELADAFDSSKQYYTQLQEFEQGRRDSGFLRRLTMQCFETYDMAKGKKIGDVYLDTQTDFFTPGTLYVLNLCTTKSTDKYFTVLTDHAAEVDKVLGPGTAKDRVREIFIKEGAGKPAEGAGKPVDEKKGPDWTRVHDKIAAHLPDEAEELTIRIKVNFYKSRKDWPNFETAIVTYMKNYEDHMSTEDLNSIAWVVFEGCPDMTCVAGILDWSKRLKNEDNPAFIDTYANILYKLGRKDDAIALETKAIGLVGDTDKPTYQQTLDKMKNGEKTWN